jgi:ribonuclease D
MLLQTSEDVAAFCARLHDAPYITVDTEFLTEKRYHAHLCLIQLGCPGHAAAVDPLVPGIDLAPVAAILADESKLKVFHAGRMDLAIFLRLFGTLPAPLADTQVMASVCGFGDQAGYGTLCEAVLGLTIDKTHQTTDWSVRPLSDAQLSYALGDVVHLCPMFEALRERVQSLGRRAWVDEEMDALRDVSAFTKDPKEAWRRVRVRRPTARTMAIVRVLAAWREETADRRDRPAGWLLRDDAMVNIAEQCPSDVAELSKVRRVTPGFAKGRDGQTVLRKVREVLSVGEDGWPVVDVPSKVSAGAGAHVMLLQALLRQRCERDQVGMALVARSGELRALAEGQRDGVRALEGWRASVFGTDALALLNGELWLSCGSDGVVERAIS